MASIRDTLANLVEQYKAGDTPMANLMRGDTEGAKKSAANAFEELAKNPYAGLDVSNPIGIAGTFIGPKSKLWNTKAHDLAQALEKKGLSQSEIWSQTFKEHGVPTARTHNESWAQEIPSNTAKISDTLKTLQTGGYKSQPVKDVSYIKRGNNYDVTLSPYNPERTTDFVQLYNLDKHLLDSALPEDVASKILKGESHQPTYMGALEDASQLNTPFEFGDSTRVPLEDTGKVYDALDRGEIVGRALVVP
jgi:hypothetical protein